MAFKVKVELLASYSLIYLLAGALNSPTISLGSKNGECTSKICNKTADDILIRMNVDEDPCVDFFEFSCGAFQTRPIPINKTSFSLGAILEEKLAEEIKDLLQRVIKEDGIKGPLIARTLVKKFMDTCLTSGNQSESGQHLLDDFKKLGGFPVLDLDWNEERFDITDTLVYMFKNGFGRNALMSFDFYIHFGTTVWKTIGKPTNVPGTDYLVNHLKNQNNSTVESYFDLMVKTVNYLGADPAMSECDMKEVLQFSMELANITISSKGKFTQVGRLHTYGREIDWLRLFENMSHNANVTSKKIYLRNEQMMYGLNKLLTKFEKRTVANFLLWSMTFDALPHLNESFLSFWDEYKLIRGLPLKNRTPKFQDCQGQISQVLGFALSSLYVSNIFGDTLKPKIESMKTKLFSVFNESMYNVSWMDDGTKKNASKKIKDMRFFIGYVNEFANETAMNIYLSMFNFTDSFYENKKQVLASKYIKYLDLERPFTAQDTFGKHTMTNRGIHYGAMNAAFLAAGYIKGYYIEENAEFNNYARIGFAIMHELGHAFDSRSRKYDHNGNDNDWWSNQSDLNYKERQKCMVTNYANCKFEGKQVNRNRTLRENIADVLTYKTLYKAYSEVSNDDKPIPKLKNYTNKQLFWISVGQYSCRKYTTEGAKSFRKYPHILEKCRINSVVSNSEEFAKDFSCPPGAKMNPSNRCTFW